MTNGLRYKCRDSRASSFQQTLPRPIARASGGLRDANQLAAEIVRLSPEEPDEPEKAARSVERSAISEYLAMIERKGGLKGGKARAEKLTPDKRSEIAKKAAKKRWAKN